MNKIKKERVWTKTFSTLFASNFIFFFGFYMIAPTLPIYIAKLGGNDAQVGAVATAFSVASVIVRLSITFLLEKFSRKTLLRAGLLLSLVMAAGYSIMKSVIGVMAFRILQGVGFGLVTTFCSSMAADALPDSRRGEGIGFFSMGTTAAIAFSPTAGLFIMNGYGFVAMFLGTAVILLFSMICVSTVKLPEASDSAQIKEQNQKIKLWNRFYDPKIWFQTILLILYGIIRASQQNYLSLLALERGLDKISVYYIIETATTFTFKFATAKVYDRYGPKATVVPGGIAAAIAMYMYSVADTNTMLLLSAVLSGVALGAIIPTFQVWIMNAVGAENRNLGSALYYNVYDIGLAIGSVIMGAIATRMNYFGMYRVAMFIMIAFVLIFIIPVACGKKIEK